VLVFHPKVTLCCGGAPDPASDSTTLPALLTKVTLADAAPETVGAYVTANEALLPVAIVTGSEIPLTENCDPLTPTDDTVTGALLAVRVAA
jgi:hypothetical protein